MLYSPLDQFKIAPLISFVVAGVDLSFTNFLLASLLALFTLQIYVFLIKDVKTNSFFVIPSGWQNLIEKIYALVTQLLSDIITTGSEKYLPFLSQAKFISTSFVTRTIEINKEKTDDRINNIEIINKKFISVFSGKWNTSVGVAKQIFRMLER